MEKIKPDGEMPGSGYTELIRSRAQEENWSKSPEEKRDSFGCGRLEGARLGCHQFTWVRIRPLLWSNNGGVQRQQRSALGARRFLIT